MNKFWRNPFTWSAVTIVLMVLLVSLISDIVSKTVAGLVVSLSSMFIGKLESYNRKDYPKLSGLSFPVAVVTCLVTAGSIVFYVWVHSHINTGGQS